MALSVHALASGSSGNTTLIKHESAAATTYLLIDAGMSLLQTRRALALHGLRPEMLAGIVISHEHIDHSRSAHALALKSGVPLIANSRTLNAIIGGKKEVPHELLPTGDRLTLGGLEIETFPVPHDARDPVGINIRCEGLKVSQITDAGCITPVMRRSIKGASLLILEANHDVHRLKAGPYPGILKERILSDRGHLSNETAVGLMVEHLLDNGPSALWLAHLSKVNNLPKLAMNYAKATLLLETRCPFVLDIALRDRPSASWTPGARSVQLSLAFS